MNSEELADALQKDQQRKAFWVNVYNALVLLELDRQSVDLQRPVQRQRFFGRTAFEIAGQRLSLDAIEHGLLRKSQLKWAKGWLSNPWPSKFERMHRLRSRDWRIHFALNCGAASCPPIRHYKAAEMDAQLALATAAFLETESRYDAATNTLTVSRLFSWYSGDFGGKQGVLNIHKQHGVLPEGKQPKLRFAQYHWHRPQ